MQHTAHDHPFDFFAHFSHCLPEKVKLPAQILSDGQACAPAPYFWNPGCKQRSSEPSLDGFAQCCSILSFQGQKRGELSVVHHIFVFSAVCTCPGSCFQRIVYYFSLFHFCFHTHRAPFLRSRPRRIQFGYEMCGRRRQQRHTSQQ